MPQDAEQHLAASLSSADESWKPGTTARNARQEDSVWIEPLIGALKNKEAALKQGEL